MTEPDPTEESLRARLRAADPAAGLLPLTGAARTRALEDAMDPHPQTDRPAPDDPDGPDGPDGPARSARRRTPWLAAAAAVVVVGGAGWAAWAAVAPGGEADAPEAGPTPAASAAPVDPTPTAGTPAGTPTQSGAAPEVTRLSLPTGGQGTARCLVPSAEVLGNQEVAFAGTVTAMDDEVVRFDVEQWYRAPATGETPTVEVEAIDERLREVVVAPEFTGGEDYLVSATGGAVTLCGFTDDDDPQLRELYDRAFG